MFFQSLFSWKKILALIGVLFLSFSSIQSQAQFADPGACSEKKEIKIADIFTTTSFTPLVPEGCGDNNGQIQPLSLAVLPAILIRGYGLMASLVFYIMTFSLVFNSLRYIYAGISPDTQRQIAAARQGITGSLVALGVVMGAYIIVFTILQVIGLDDVANTDITSFFTF